MRGVGSMPDFHHGRDEHSNHARNGSRAANRDPAPAHFDRVGTQKFAPARRCVDPGPERLPHLPDLIGRFRPRDRWLFRAGPEKINRQTREKEEPNEKKEQKPAAPLANARLTVKGKRFLLRFSVFHDRKIVDLAQRRHGNRSSALARQFTSRLGFCYFVNSPALTGDLVKSQHLKPREIFVSFLSYLIFLFAQGGLGGFQEIFH